ncbi:unnamed protein product [Lathyrus sativus]|nr:unnamed protein product [Lathyrus sativus]
MGRGRGRGCGWPRLVPPSITDPTTVISDQQATGSDAMVDDELQNNLVENGSLVEEDVENVFDAGNLGHQSTEGKLKVEASQSKKLWVDIINENRNPTKGLTMEFVAPNIIDGEMEIQIEEEDVEKEVKFWESALIMYALGVDLSMNAVKQFMSKSWNFVKLPDMFYNEEGFFILRFHSFQDKDLVLMKGSYSICNRPMMLREWKPDFCMSKDMLRTIPLWVKLPQLPLHIWGARSLSKIGSALGTPLVTDECTTNKLRVSYARILVEIDITQELKTHILIRDEKGARLNQPIEYEWKPLYCQRCHKIGHNCDKPSKPHKEWKLKVT